jgi:RHS repeat-associated protein
MQVAGVTLLLELALFFSPTTSILLAASATARKQSPAPQVRPHPAHVNTVPPKSQEISSHRPKLGLSLKSLDLMAPPSETDLRKAGQLGGQLSPSRSADPARISDIASQHKQQADNLAFGQAIQKWNEHKYSEAATLFRAHRQSFADSPWAGEAELHLGCNAQFSGSWAEAKASFDWILSNTAKGSDIYQKAKLRRSILHVAQGELAEAKQSFAEMLQSESEWDRKTYANFWLQQLSLYGANQVALRTCGRDSVAYVLEQKGRHKRANQLRSAVAPGERGYSLGELVDCAQHTGLKASAVHADISQLRSIPTPFVAHYLDEHFVVVKSVSASREVRLFDTRLQHDCLLTWDQFIQQWSGLAVVFGKRSHALRLAASSELTDVMGGCCGLPAYPSNLGPIGPMDACGMPKWQVNPVNMNLVVQDVPMWYDCPIGPRIEIKLTYNSQDSLNQLRPFGNKWVLNYASYAMESPNSSFPAGSVLIVMPEGKGDVYEPGSGGAYVSPPGVFNTLTKLSAYTYNLALPDGTIYHYGVPSGVQGTSSLLLSIEDRKHNFVTINHDSNAVITGITDPQNNTTSLRYNSQGLIELAIDPFGRRAAFSYDPSGNLVGQTDMGGISYSYTYDSNVYVTSITKPSGTTLFYVEPADGVNNGSNHYPAPGGLMWQDYRITITDTLGYQEEYYYEGFSAYGWYRDKNQYLSSLPVLNAPKTRYDFRLLGSPPFSEGVISKVTYADGNYISVPNFDSNTRLPQTITDENGYTTTFTYNSMGRVLTKTDPRNVAPANQFITTYHYALNNVDLLYVTDFFHGASHPAISLGYDANRNVNSISDGLWRTTTISHNQYGQPDTITDATTQARVCHYNALQQLTSITQNGQTLLSIMPDAIGRPAAVTNVNGYTVNYKYDDLNRLLRTSYPDGTYAENEWGCCHLDAQRDRAGNVTRFIYDELNREIFSVDSGNRGLQYEYDPVGNLTKLIDGAGNPTGWAYDSRNRVDKKTYADSSFYLYDYDGAGNLWHRTDANQIVTTFGYDQVNNLQSVSAPGLTTISFLYDSLNRRTQMTDGTGTTTFGYDLASQLTSINGPTANALVQPSYDALGRYTGHSINQTGATSLAYDNYGRPSTVTNPLGTFTYNYPTGPSTLLSSITSTAGPSTALSYLDTVHDQRLGEILYKDSSNQVISKFDYAYDVLGQITNWTQQAGPAAANTYGLVNDPVGQLTSAALTDSTGASLKNYSYTYDLAGNRKSETIDSLVSSDTPNNLNQLTSRASGVGVMPIRGTTDKPARVTVNGIPATPKSNTSFEGRANVTAGNNTVTVVATDASGNVTTNRYNVVASGSGTKSLMYDANGNLKGDGTRTFEWDPLDRLTAVTSGTHRSEFTYNGLSQRVKIVEKDNGAVTSTRNLIWCFAEICEERDANNNVTKRYYPQGMQVGSTNYYYTRDHLGSVRELTDSSGAVQARYDYDLYGRRTKLSGSVDADFGFTGHYYHQPSGLHLALYRAYDADLGRWISRDPYSPLNLLSTGVSARNSLLLRESLPTVANRSEAEFLPEGPNLYAYVANDPINLYDEDGRFLWIPVIVLIVVLAYFNNSDVAYAPENQEQASKAKRSCGMIGMVTDIAASPDEWAETVVKSGLEGMTLKAALPRGSSGGILPTPIKMPPRVGALPNPPP